MMSHRYSAAGTPGCDKSEITVELLIYSSPRDAFGIIVFKIH